MSDTCSPSILPPRSASAASTSRNVSMPMSWPWSITTSEPMSCSDMTLTASSTAPSGAVVKSVLPLMRRISLTSMGPPSLLSPARLLLLTAGRQPLAAAAVQVIRQPQRHAWPHVHDDHAQDHDQHVRHHAREDLVQRHMRWRDALQIERRHGDRRRQERGLQVHEHERAPEDGIDLEVLQQRQEDRHEDDDD